MGKGVALKINNDYQNNHDTDLPAVITQPSCLEATSRP